MATRVRSYSKINLGLAVGPKRGDGFHELRTVYQTIGLHDFVTVTARRTERTRVVLTANHAGVPRTETGDAERNTAWKMVVGTLERMGMTAEVEIAIDKRLPVQGGMGAGSANAVAALLGLERELGVGLPGAERLALAAEVGSDVPLFLLGGTVLGLGRGEEVHPLEEIEGVGGLACVVAVPELGVSTALAFRELDKRQGVGSREQGVEGHTGGLKPQIFDEPMRPEAGASGYPGAEAEDPGHPEGEGLGSRAQDPEDSGPKLKHEGSLTSGVGVDKLEELSRALAAVWKTSGGERGPSGIAPTNRPEMISGNLSNDFIETQSGSMEVRYRVSANGLGDVRGDLAENPLLALVRTGIENDFEEVVFSQYPSLRSTKRDLMGSSGDGALYAALSGSGSALFGLYKSEADARAAQYRVQENGTRAILTETLSRREYWRAMFE
jgi:4-diphosphocytidyl-2-C-methyl-D-erythritol kinase